MTKELTVKYKWQDKELEISPSIVRRYISTSKNVTDQEVKDFMDLCIYQHLNPFIKEAYLIKYGQEKANIVTSKDVFDKRAFRDPKYDGEEVTNNYKRGMNLMDLWVRTKIYHKGLSHPASDVTVYYSEYVGKKRDGTITKIWRTKPVTMLTKVSKAQAKREANPEELARLYLTEEFDQEERPTENVIREVDITPKREESAMPFNPQDEGQVTQKEEEIIDKAFEQVEAEVEEQEQAEMGFEPASQKQLDFIYGTKDKKGIVDSHLITKAEVKRIGKAKDLSKEKASKILAWWWGDKDKNIIGEREKREKNPKIEGENAFERRAKLMQEVLDLMKENHIKKTEAKEMYKKFQKDEIIKLATEELEELKQLLENYVPDWK